MALIREMRFVGQQEDVTVHLRRRDGSTLVSLIVRANSDGSEPLDVWVDNPDDVVIEPAHAPVTLIWDTEPLGGLRLVQLLRRVPPHDRFDYVRYPALVAKQIVAAGWGRAVGVDEERELDNPRLYIPHGMPHFGARRD